MGNGIRLLLGFDRGGGGRGDRGGREEGFGLSGARKRWSRGRRERGKVAAGGVGPAVLRVRPYKKEEEREKNKKKVAAQRNVQRRGVVPEAQGGRWRVPARACARRGAPPRSLLLSSSLLCSALCVASACVAYPHQTFRDSGLNILLNHSGKDN